MLLLSSRLQQFPEANHIRQINSLLHSQCNILSRSITHVDLILANALYAKVRLWRLKWYIGTCLLWAVLVSGVSEWKSSGFGPLLMHYSWCCSIASLQYSPGLLKVTTPPSNTWAEAHMTEQRQCTSLVYLMLFFNRTFSKVHKWLFTYCDNDKYCNYLSYFLTGEWNSEMVWRGRSCKRRPKGNLWADLHCNQQIFEENYFPFGSGLQTRLCISAQIFTAIVYSCFTVLF